MLGFSQHKFKGTGQDQAASSETFEVSQLKRSIAELKKNVILSGFFQCPYDLESIVSSVQTLGPDLYLENLGSYLQIVKNNAHNIGNSSVNNSSVGHTRLKDHFLL